MPGLRRTQSAELASTSQLLRDLQSPVARLMPPSPRALPGSGGGATDGIDEPASTKLMLATMEMVRPLVHYAAASSSSLMSTASRQVWSRGENAVASVASRLAIRRAMQGFVTSSLTLADMDAAADYAIKPRAERLAVDLAAASSALDAEKRSRDRYRWLANNASHLGVMVGLATVVLVGASAVTEQAMARAVLSSVSGLVLLGTLATVGAIVLARMQAQACAANLAKHKLHCQVLRGRIDEQAELRAALHDVHAVLLHRAESQRRAEMQRPRAFAHRCSDASDFEDYQLLERLDGLEPPPSPAHPPGAGRQA